MKRSLVLVALILFDGFQIVFAEKNNCFFQIPGYKVVKNTVFPFKVGQEKACFFAFYTPNPDPMIDFKGNGNLGDAIWYGYYKSNNVKKFISFKNHWIMTGVQFVVLMQFHFMI